MKRLLIIPARKNSKRIKNKNFYFFIDKPIIYFSIETALKSKIFNKIHISTDSKYDGKEILKKFNIDVDYKRPNHLSNDKVGLMDVFRYVVKQYEIKGQFFEEIWFMSPCSPLINIIDLKKASHQFLKKRCDILLSVAKYSQIIERSFELNNGFLKPLNKYNLKLNTQKFKYKYFHTGNFSIFNKDIFYKKKKIKKYLGYEIPLWRAVDIDNPSDLEITKRLYNSIKQ